MEPLRKPFTGVWNIIRFNRDYYLAAIGLIASLLLLRFVPAFPRPLLAAVTGLVLFLLLASLLASWYIYDLSKLYSLYWLNPAGEAAPGTVLNIHAGFDETSVLLRKKFPAAKLEVLDFYNPRLHTEASLRRARKASGVYPGTRAVSTGRLPAEDGSADLVTVIFAAHEIRDDMERREFFRELGRVLKDGGRIVVAEHLRDTANFCVYTLGSFHFYSRSSWLGTFRDSGLELQEEVAVTPFIRIFTLKKNGAAP